HVSASLKGERIKNPVTGKSEPPDEALMAEVEGLIGREALGGETPAEGRGRLMGRIAAWSLDHMGTPVAESDVVRELLGRLRRAVFQQRQAAVAEFCRALVVEDAPRTPQQSQRVEAALLSLTTRGGYTQKSARDAAARLIGERYA